MLFMQLAAPARLAGLLVISRTGMSSHWRLIISKRRFVPVQGFCTVSRRPRGAARAADSDGTAALPLRSRAAGL